MLILRNQGQAGASQTSVLGEVKTDHRCGPGNALLASPKKKDKKGSFLTLSKFNKVVSVLALAAYILKLEQYRE